MERGRTQYAPTLNENVKGTPKGCKVHRINAKYQFLHPEGVPQARDVQGAEGSSFAKQKAEARSSPT